MFEYSINSIVVADVDGEEGIYCIKDISKEGKDYFVVKYPNQQFSDNCKIISHNDIKSVIYRASDISIADYMSTKKICG